MANWPETMGFRCAAQLNRAAAMNVDLIAIIMGGVVLAAVIGLELVRGTLPGFAREHRSTIRAQRKAKAQRTSGRS